MVKQELLLTPEDCPLCKGSGEVLNRKIRMMGYTLSEGETIDEELVPCPLCEYIKAQLAKVLQKIKGGELDIAQLDDV